jgi:hypothetical protein
VEEGILNTGNAEVIQHREHGASHLKVGDACGEGL